MQPSPKKPRSKRFPILWTLLGVFLVLLVLGAVWVYFNQQVVRHVLAHWTGEDDLMEQLKGTAALIYLRATRLPPQTEPFAPVAHTDVCPYGVNTFLQQEVEIEKVERSLQLVADAGFCWIRQQFPWEDIEISAKGDYWDHKWNRDAWEKYDHIVDLAEQYGIGIIARLDAPPAWSRKMGSAPGWTMAPPDNYEDYGDFVYAVVSRYKGRIRYYQLWNEPNIYPEWGDQPADPAAFVALLKIGYLRAKEADPDCVIIAAGLAQTTEETPAEFKPRNMSDLLYLQKMYEAGVRGYFDIMGAQVYGLWTGPYDRRVSRDRSNFSRVQLLREIMVRNGDADKPIWATEVGWNALPEDFAAFPNYGRVSEEKQAIYAVEAYQRAAREWPWMGVMNYWFLRRPSDAEKDQTWYYFRLFEPDFTPLPAYGALDWLGEQWPTMPMGYHQESHWTLHYTGPWQHLRDDAAVLGAFALGGQGAELGFYFFGTDLALVLRDARQIENLEITIDGYEVAALAPWAAPREDTAVITVARNLKDERHRVRLRVVDGQVALDGVIVRRHRPSVVLGVAGGIGLGLAIYALFKHCKRAGEVANE